MQGKKEHFVDGATPPLPLPKLLASVLLPYYPTRNFDRLFFLLVRVRFRRFPECTLSSWLACPSHPQPEVCKAHPRREGRARGH